MLSTGHSEVSTIALPENYGMMGDTEESTISLRQDFSTKSNANSYYLSSVYHMSGTALSPSYIFLLNPSEQTLWVGTVILLIVLMRKLRSETLNDSSLKG